MPKCPKHPNVELICPSCSGPRGGRSRSPAKQASSRRNGKLGGEMNPEVRQIMQDRGVSRQRAYAVLAQHRRRAEVDRLMAETGLDRWHASRLLARRKRQEKPAPHPFPHPTRTGATLGLPEKSGS